MAAKEKWRVTKVSKTRKFAGKVYRLVNWYFGLMEAKVGKANWERRGFLVRMTTRKGLGGRPNYYLWARKK